MGTTFFIAPALTALAAVGSSGVAGGRWQLWRRFRYTAPSCIVYRLNYIYIQYPSIHG